MIDPYKILGVNKKASQEDIKKAFRSKSKDLHPDAGNNDDNAFKDISRAYAILKSPEKKKIFDETGNENNIHSQENITTVAIQKVIMLIDELLHKHTNPLDVDVIDLAKKNIDNFINENNSNISKIKNEIKKLKNYKKRFKFKPNSKLLTNDILQNMFDEKIINAKRQIADIKYHIKIARVGYKLLDCYAFDFDKKRSDFNYIRFNIGTQTTAW